MFSQKYLTTMLRSELSFFVVNEDKYHGYYHPQGRLQEFFEGGGFTFLTFQVGLPLGAE